jgi:hypothetical protein
MQFRRLGRDGPEISVVGVGAWAIGGPGRLGWGPQDDDESIAALHKAFDSGVNWVDTAAVYGLGHSEEVVGQVLDQRAAGAVHDALRHAGGARGIQDVEGVIERERLEVERLLEGARDRDPVSDRARHRGWVGRAMLHQHARLGVGKDRPDPIGRQPVVHRRQRRTQQPGGEQRLQERRMVGPEPRHPVAAPYPKPTQSIGQAPNPPGQLHVGERAIASHQRHLVWGDPGSTLNPGADPEVGRNRRHPGHGQGYPPLAPCRQEATPATQTLNAGGASPRPGFLAHVEENSNGYAVKRSHPDLWLI